MLYDPVREEPGTSLRKANKVRNLTIKTMKKQLLRSVLLICTTLTLISTNAFAGHNEGTHRSCPWYWHHRYWAEAHVGCGWSFSGSYDQGCSWAFASASRSCNCGLIGKAQSWSNGSSIGGWVHNAGGTWGGKYADLAMEIGDPYFMPAPPPPPPVCGFADEQDIVLKPLMGNPVSPVVGFDSITLHFMSDMTSPLTNTYTLTVWLPDNDDDSVVTPSKTIAYSTVNILNGNLTVSGSIFQAADFITLINPQNGTMTVNYVGGPKSVLLPPGVTSSMIDINSQGDIKSDQTAMFRTITGSSATQQIAGDENFILYPNPANTKVSLEFNMKEDRVVDLGVYDMTGKLVMEEKQVAVKAGAVQVVDLNISKLPQGEYYILAKNKDIKVLKQFLKL